MLLAPPGDRGEGSGHEEGSGGQGGRSAFSRFSRDSVRLSMLGSETLARWAEAADRTVLKVSFKSTLAFEFNVLVTHDFQALHSVLL